MPRFPRDLARNRAIKAFEALGFRTVRSGAHIVMARINDDGPETSFAMPNHIRIKSSTLRAICTQASVTRVEFLRAVQDS